MKLIDHYSAERSNEMYFISDCVEAANANEHIERAKRYMEHQCNLCYNNVAKCNVSIILKCLGFFSFVDKTFLFLWFCNLTKPFSNELQP